MLRLWVPQQSQIRQVLPSGPGSPPPACLCLSLELGLTLSPILCWEYGRVKMLENDFFFFGFVLAFQQGEVG